MSSLDLGAAVRLAQPADPASIPDVIQSLAGAFGASDVVLYLVDFGQSTLGPLPDRRLRGEVPQSEPVATSMAGRCFVDQRVIIAEREAGFRIWVPVVEGSDRTGVLAMTVPDSSNAITQACEDLGLFTGYLIATQARFTDFYSLRRRRKSMSLAASMQWDLLPPLVLKSDRVTVAGLIEPAYDVGGDCFDYALNDVTFDLAIFDPMGHGVEAALAAALVVGSYRHDRRQTEDLSRIHTHLDERMAERFEGAVFATGLLSRFNLENGEMCWTSAGHYPPILIRSDVTVGALACNPTTPWGLGSLDISKHAVVATEHLEPGDSILFFTDGVIEARQPGGFEFGLERLVDLAGQHASNQIEPEETARLILRAVLDHQNGGLNDDATLVLFRWNGPGSGASKGSRDS